MGDYGDILYEKRPVSERYHMDIGHRAKQFAPFAALKGFEDCVAQKEILFEERMILSEEGKEELDRRFRMLSCGMEICVTYYEESVLIPGKGLYRTIEGMVAFWDPDHHLRIDDTEIRPVDIVDLSGDVFEVLEGPL